jgi:two-component system sensor histidine kinase YesM
MENSGWTIVLLADRSSITGRITSYQWYLYPALALLTVLFLVYAGLLARERELRERERVKAELEALRFQISPHFVSNTLSSIRLMALAANAGGIGQMTQDLMRILADSYAEAGSLTPLSRELGNLQSYVGIMKARFGEHFDVRYEIAEDTRDLLILRLILQPVVENAILHGFAGSESRGTIQVTSRRERLPGAHAPALPEAGVQAPAGRCLVIEIRDDGVGMDPALAFAPPATGQPGLHHIGLANVQRRIRLNFGEPFGLSVQSERGRFTLVRFLLPEARARSRAGA